MQNHGCRKRTPSPSPTPHDAELPPFLRFPQLSGQPTDPAGPQSSQDKQVVCVGCGPGHVCESWLHPFRTLDLWQATSPPLSFINKKDTTPILSIQFLRMPSDRVPLRVMCPHFLLLLLLARWSLGDARPSTQSLRRLFLVNLLHFTPLSREQPGWRFGVLGDLQRLALCPCLSDTEADCPSEPSPAATRAVSLWSSGLIISRHIL